MPARGGIVLGSPEEVDRLPDLAKVCVVAQTTQNMEEYATIVRRIRVRFPAAVVFDTICDSTEKRQTEIKALAAGTDALFIVGGRNSANTQRLAELAKGQGKPAFHIETADELSNIDIEPYRRISVSAGASTPNWIIDRVVDNLTGRLGRREEFFRHLFKIWVFTVRTDIYSAAGAGCLSLAAMLLQGLPVDPLHILTASLYVYAMHTLNRFINRKASSISSFREESYLLHEKIYVTLAILAMILALGASLFIGPRPFILLFAISLSGILYNMRFLPPPMAVSGPEGDSRIEEHRHPPWPGERSRRFCHGSIRALRPTPGLAVAFVFTTGIVFIRSALSDILDIQSDRLIGRETLPVLIGEERTLIFLRGISAVLFLILLTASPAGWSTSVSFVLLTAVFYIWICLKLYDRRSGFSGVVLEGLLESCYIVAGLCAFLWLMATGSVNA